MILRFQKYHGTGNDFILVNNMDGKCDSLTKEVISRLCQRHFGIGSDGLILLRATDEADYWMDFYNPDGSQSFCGNGSRCAFQFAHDLGLVSNKATFKAIDGIHEVRYIDGEIAIQMNDVYEVERLEDDFFIHTGSPHYILYLEELETLNIIEQAHQIRYNKRFSKEGTNVNFVKEEEGGIQMRTYERGVENETLSCGTGVTAAALSYATLNETTQEVKVETRGGKLKVKFEKNKGGFTDIWLIGSATFVFEGNIEI